MEVVICPSESAVADVAAAKIAQVLRAASGAPVLGVATGSSPIGVYQALAALVAAGQLDLAEAHAFALDEYVGLPVGHPESYAEVIRRTVTEPLRLDPARVHLPNGFFAQQNGIEFALILFGVALAVMIKGAGRWSLDELLMRVLSNRTQS